MLIAPRLILFGQQNTASGLYQLIVYQYDVMDRHIVNAIASIKDAIIVYKQLLHPTRRTVSFGNHPNLDPGNTECVHGHQPESLLK